MSIPAENERIKTIRNSLGMGQREFSATIGMTQPAYSELERGRGFSYPTFKKIIVEHGINPFWLMFGHGEMYGKSVNSAPEELKARLNEWLDGVENGTRKLRERINSL